MPSHYDPDLHHRRSIRLRGFDYASPGVYFVTCIVRKRLCLFGEIVDGVMFPNLAGEMMAEQWLALEERFSFCIPHRFVVMPNHFHGLLVFKPSDDFEPFVPLSKGQRPHGTANGSLGRVMQAYKSCATDEYIKGVHEQGWEPFEKKLLLRNYWERIIRNEEEWHRAVAYIDNNPRRWAEDKHHPETNARLRAERRKLRDS